MKYVLFFVYALLLVSTHISLSTVHASSGNDSLVGYWKLDSSGSTVPDSSGDGNTGTKNGSGGSQNLPQYSTNVPYTTFPDPESMTFDGTDDRVALPAGFANFTNGLTIAVWARPTSNGTFARFIDFGNGDASDNIIFGRQGTSNSFYFEVYDGATTTAVVATNALTNNEWHHYAVTEASDGSVILYKDGSQVQTGSTNVPNNLTRNNNYIGGSNWGADAYYQGSMDDIRVYNRVLSPTEIEALGAGNHTSATWDGSSSLDYETAANWDINAVPDPYTKITISDVANQASASAHISTAGLTISSSAWLDLAGFNLTMNDTSNTSGLATNAGTLRLQNSQSVTNFINDTDSGTILLNPITNTTGLKSGNNYYNLILNDSLLGYWKVDETSSGSFVDSSGYDASGVGAGSGGTNNTPQPATNVPLGSFINTRSLDFDGTDDAVTMTDFDVSPKAISIALWAYWRDSGNTVEFLTAGSTNERFEIHTGGGGGNNGLRCIPTNGVYFDTDENVFLSNQWNHVVCVYDPSTSTGQIYINGQAVTSTSKGASLATPLAATSLLHLGKRSDNTYFFNGRLDDIRVYNRPLRATEIRELSNGKQPRSGVSTTVLGSAVDINGLLTLSSGGLDVSDGDNYAITLAGNWQNDGGYLIPRSGTVTLDGGNQSLSSGETFYNLTKSVSSARTLTLPQRGIATSSGGLTLSGTSGNLLTIASAVSGTQAKIDP